MTHQMDRLSHHFVGGKVFHKNEVVFSNDLMPPYEKGVLLGTCPAPRDGTHILFATDGDCSGHIFVLDPALTIMGHRPRRVLSVPFVPTDIIRVATNSFGEDCLLAAGHGLQSGVALIDVKSGIFEWIMHDTDLQEHPDYGIRTPPPLLINLNPSSGHAVISCGPKWNRDIAPPLRRNDLLWEKTTELMRHYQRTGTPRHPLLIPEL